MDNLSPASEENASTTHRVVVEPAHDGERLDAFLSGALELARNQCARWVQEGRACINGVAARRPARRVRTGDRVDVEPPMLAPATAEAQAIALHFHYEDDDVAVVSKPAGMVVHPSAGHADGTLVNALLHHCDALSGIGGVERPGIVHRIDRETSGLLVVTKNDRAHQHLQRQFADHSIERTYRALAAQTHGPALPDRTTLRTRHTRHPQDRKRFTGRAGGDRIAVTHLNVLERFRDGGLFVELRLETGRTHQIRMHLSEAGAPLLGDALYGGRAVAGTALISRVALHARTLGFEHPDGRWLRFVEEPPDDFLHALERLRRGASWRA